MIKATSVSGGKSSAYLAMEYPTELNLFSLIRVEDRECLWMKGKDEKTRRLIEDKIQKPFIGTAEDDSIIYTILDLEQLMGREITWTSGKTFEQVIVDVKNNMLPNKAMRFCTTHLKIEPLFYWWAENIGEPIEMQIGYRANETDRRTRMNEKRNENGFLEFKATFEKHKTGRHKGNNKWENIEWQSPTFPMMSDGILKDNIVEYWKGKNVRFAWKNNCVHCFYQDPLLLRKRFEETPSKIVWASKMEKIIGGKWRSDVSYQQIMNANLQHELSFDDFSDECETGCGI